MESLALLVAGILLGVVILGVLTIVFSILAWRGKVNRWVAYGFLVAQMLVTVWGFSTQTAMATFAAVPLFIGGVFSALPRKK